ncbi:TPA: hypothetical protein DCQ44_02495 [Candidatus Taylorbacteria bacterium]|nr:hypothetical protein [Candidatus Taylorbacteria bacterium]
MTNSFALALFGYAILAVVFILDKSILTKTLKNPAVYAFYSTIFFIPLFLLSPFFSIPSAANILWATVSGLAFGFALWASFIAFKHGETSHISPFIGAITALATYFFSFLILKGSLNGFQEIGLALLVISSLLISFEKSREHNGFHIGFIWAMLSGVLYALSHVSAKYIYDLYPFVSGLIWTKSTIGLVGLVILLVPNLRRSIFSKKGSVEPKTAAAEKSHTFGIVLSDKILSIVGVLAIQYAIAIGNVTIVNALAGVQYVLMFIFIYLLTKFRPKVFYEYFTKKEVLIQVIAILLAASGLLFLK